MQRVHGRLHEARGVGRVLARTLRVVLDEGARRKEAVSAVQGDSQGKGSQENLPIAFRHVIIIMFYARDRKI